MKQVYIDHLSVCLGDQLFAVDESVAAGRLMTAAADFKEAGFSSHRVCLPNTTAYDLAKRAVTSIQPQLGDIGAIIYATCLPLNGNIGVESEFHRTRDVKHLMDFPASHMQADFGLERASVIGLNQQACTSMLGSMRLARALLLTEPDLGRVLIVSSDRFPEGAHYEQAYNVISDGAAACIASLVPSGYRLLATHAITNGALAQATDDETVGSYFSYTHRLISETLSKANLTSDDLAWVVPQNTNVNAWAILARLLRIDFEKVFFGSIQDVGHIISSDNIVNLKRLEEQNKLKSGDKLLLFMAGFGLNWQAIVLERV